ncbi:hypothetical protein IAI51_09720 [Pseudomonas sp. N40(2020)]|uniref:hypothetical protein n=1 Tax=Pseudomonas sp. N40(2020) TaxID=2767798 RepID=UPI001657462D|nr:hypothetical protein [Pseudomonas sp. N40(2020)]MBC8996803.1 hypothetical protein [Pseudomonas sp. N40(2020)]
MAPTHTAAEVKNCGASMWSRIVTTDRICLDAAINRDLLYLQGVVAGPRGANGGIRIDIEVAGAQAAHTWLPRLIKTGVRPLQLTAALQLTGRLASEKAQALRESFQL